jgi:tape measure domain-containing protein
MHKAMGVVLNTFESMQQASGRAVDTAAIREAREEWAKAGTAFDAIEENIRNANNEQQKFNNSIRGGNNSANGLLSTIKKIAVAAGGIVGINKVQNISDKLASTKARLNLLVDDGGSVDVLEQKIMASAQRSRSVYFDTASAVAKLGLNAGNAFNGDMNQVIAFMEQVNKQFVIGGATAQEQSNAMIQLTQAMAAGALRGEELNSILDGAPGIARAIEKYMGIAEGSIKTVAQEGKVTAEVVKNAMFAMADETNAKFDSMPKTWAQIWAGMKNKALSMFAPILTKINQIANSTKFQQVTTALINGLAGVANVASSLLDILISVASVIVDNWSWIQPIIMGIVAAMLIYNGVALVTNAIMGIQATAKAVHAAATAMEAGATFTATVAQQGLNAALLACPLTWIILLIIAVIAAIYAACAAVAKFTGIANSGFGVICGGIMVVISFFKNLGLSVANIALGIWNALGACASNIGTAFHNVISNVQGWFYNLLSTALTVVAGICEALNKLPFVEFDYSEITSKASEYAAKSAEAYGNVEEYKSVADAFNEGMSTFDTFQDGWAADAFASGAAWGDGVADKVSGMFDFSALDSMGADSLDAFNLGNDLDSIYGNTGDIANNTAATADALDIAEEDLAYLRDIAEREAINRFTTAEIKVEQHNENHISKDADLDGIMDAWANDFAEKLEVSEEGVHE